MVVLGAFCVVLTVVGGVVYHFATKASTGDDQPFLESIWTAWTFVTDTGLHTEEVSPYSDTWWLVQ